MNKEIFDNFFFTSSYESTIIIISFLGLYIENPKTDLIFLAKRIILQSETFHFLKSSSLSSSIILLFQSILYNKQHPSFSYITNNKLSLINSKNFTLFFLFILPSFKSIFLDLYSLLNTSFLLFSFSVFKYLLSFPSDIDIESFLIKEELFLFKDSIFFIGALVNIDIFFNCSSKSFLDNESIFSFKLPISLSSSTCNKF